jgi:hypothetical protein
MANGDPAEEDWCDLDWSKWQLLNADPVRAAAPSRLGSPAFDALALPNVRPTSDKRVEPCARGFWHSRTVHTASKRAGSRLPRRDLAAFGPRDLALGGALANT